MYSDTLPKFIPLNCFPITYKNNSSHSVDLFRPYPSHPSHPNPTHTTTKITIVKKLFFY